jgi:hypothetical protein
MIYGEWGLGEVISPEEEALLSGVDVLARGYGDQSAP